MRGLVQAWRGRERPLNILGLAIGLVLWLTATPSAPAQTYTLLHNFTNGEDGGAPNGDLIQDSEGNLYGTASQGGAPGCYLNAGCGTVFELAKTGTLTTLYTFSGGSDGGDPYSGLVLSGNTLYGTTLVGGDNTACNGQGCGVVFALDIKSSAETVLHTFTGGADGLNPWAGLVQDKAGVLYGATASGGGTGCGGHGCGVVFKLLPKTGVETVLHSFTGTDGSYPLMALALDATRGVLYGTTSYGGSSGSGCGGSGCGVVFSLTLKSAKYAVLHNFSGKLDGGDPYQNGALSIGEGGVFGTTEQGGNSGCGSLETCGVVFELVPNARKETVLYAFTGMRDGGNPEGGVLPDKQGRLIGTTCFGGANNKGTIFELDPKSRKESVLHSFNGANGSAPLGDLY